MMIGKAVMYLGIDTISDILASKRRVFTGTKFFIVRRGDFLVAASTAYGTAVRTYSLTEKDNFTVSTEDRARGCEIALPIGRPILGCPLSVDDFGDPDLQSLRDEMPEMLDPNWLVSVSGKEKQKQHQHRIDRFPSPAAAEECATDPTEPVTPIVIVAETTLRELTSSSGRRFYAAAIPLAAGCSENMDWVLVTLTPR